MLQHIAKFNPYNMEDETVLALATGRKQLLKETLQTLEDNLQQDSGPSHLLIFGPRGMGKSFFLKYLSIKFKANPIFKNCDFVSLPEEQSNIKCTTDLLKMVLAYLKGNSFENVTAIWEETEEVWEEQLKLLVNVIKQKREKLPNYSLVVVMENINEFLDKLRSEKKQAKIKEARFRNLLEHVEGLTLIGASPRANVDSNYNKRLFKAWKPLKLKSWGEEAYHKYFERRYQLEVKRTGKKLSPEQYKLRQDKLRAIHKYSGGSPRMAVVLSNLLLEDDAISTAQTLYGLIDDLTPYYQNLTSKIPDRPRQLLDTLIRLGENKSQSEIAKYLGTSQNSVSRHFLWLQDNGYILGKKRTGSRQFRYYLADRIYVLFYQDREVFHGQDYTPVWLLSDFLVSFYQVDELVERTVKYVKTNPTPEAFDFARISLKGAGWPEELWPIGTNPKNWLHTIKLADFNYKARESINDLFFILFGIILNNKKKQITNYRFEELLKLVKRALLFFKETDNKESEAKTLEVLGMLNECNSLKDEAIYYYEQAIKLRKNKLKKVFNLIRLGECHYYLNQYKKSIINLKIALNLTSHDFKNKELVRFQIHSILLFAYRDAQNDNEAFNSINKMVDLTKKIEERPFLVGLKSAQYILLQKGIKAWDLLIKYESNKEKVFKQFGDAVFLTEKRTTHAKAYQLGNNILHELKNRKIDLNYPLALSMFFANLLNMGISNSLFQELCQSALKIYTNPHEKVVLSAALHTAEYIKGEKEPKFLEQLSPDMAIAVKAIVEEGNL